MPHKVNPIDFETLRRVLVSDGGNMGELRLVWVPALEHEVPRKNIQQLES